MTRVPNQFIDPAGNVSTFNWPINHKAENTGGKERNIQHGANTANVGLIKQQSDDSPMVLEYTGRILEEAQNEAFWEWYELSDSQTIYFYDFAGAQYEVQITSYKPIRVGVAKNPRGGTTNPYHVYDYTIRMEVYRILAGPAMGVAP